ncbi:MAG: cyclase family protein [Prolixibacteraceae bacterium]|jgi:kynurenine formamidase|nr:cyclase family protein [Prolixibacteraceae bacterium]
MECRLDIELNLDHPAYLWAKKQSDSVNALGHIGTHLDCYTSSPEELYYDLECIVFDCTHKMVELEDIASSDMEGKAVILHTNLLHSVGYGSKEYGEAKTFLSEAVLEYILSQKPKFILIDACGIGNHGDEHILFDKKCEANNCYVIENVFLDKQIVENLERIVIEISEHGSLTGKPCSVKALLRENK